NFRECLKTLTGGLLVYTIVAACSGADSPNGVAGSNGGSVGMNGDAGAGMSTGGLPDAHANTGGASSCDCPEPIAPEPDVFIDAPCTGSEDSPFVCIETSASSREDLIGKFSALVTCEDGGAGFGPPGRGFVPMMGIEDSGRICAHCTSPTGVVGSCESGKVVTFRIAAEIAQ